MMEQEHKVGRNMGNMGKGRPKGTPNKTTALLKDAILQAAENAGNQLGANGMVSYLEAQAMANPGPFMSLLGKVIPMQITGADDANGKPTAIQINIVDPRS